MPNVADVRYARAHVSRVRALSCTLRSTRRVKSAVRLRLHCVMNSSRSPRSTYAAAFLLGALIALLLVRPGRAAEAAGAAETPTVTALR